jgi:hypothetical protein
VKQTAEAKADAKEIAKYIVSCSPRKPGYAHYTCLVQLCSVPNDWTPDRVKRALIDQIDGGWSPFGGRGQMISASKLIWQITVHTD